MKQLIDKIDRLVLKAKSGDSEAQYELAKSLYYGNGVERDKDLAMYWAYKAIKKRVVPARALYSLIEAPHFTGNEKYTTFGGQYDVKLSSSSLLASSRFRGHYDRLKGNEQLYRTYKITRLGLIYFPAFTAYRVYEVSQNSWKILGEEKVRFWEMMKWPLISVFIHLAFILWCVLL